MIFRVKIGSAKHASKALARLLSRNPALAFAARPFLPSSNRLAVKHEIFVLPNEKIGFSQHACEALFRVEVEVELCGVNIVTFDEAHYLNVDVVPCFEELEDLLVDSFEVKVLD